MKFRRKVRRNCGAFVRSCPGRRGFWIAIEWLESRHLLSGSFFTGTQVYEVANLSAVASADFNGDGLSDLAVTNLSDPALNIYFNLGDGTFGPATVYAHGDYPVAIVSADFNGDKLPDVATCSPAVLPSFANIVSVFLNTGDGTFAPPVDCRQRWLSNKASPARRCATA